MDIRLRKELRGLFPAEKTQDQAEDYAQQDRGCDGEIEREIVPLYDYITGQPSEPGNFRPEHQDQAQDRQHDPEDEYYFTQSWQL